MSPVSQSADVPIPPDLSRRYDRSVAGRAWLASLPALIGQRLEHWELDVDLKPGALPWSGRGAIVVPVRRRHADGIPDGGTPVAAALKVAFPHEDAVRERQALALWDGDGAVGLLAADAGSCALLLERLDAGRSLLDISPEAAAPVWGDLVRRLSLVPDSRPQWREFDHVAAMAERWSDELPQTWEELGRPFPRWLLEAALEVCQTRGVVGRRSGIDVLVHTDMHYGNVLARCGTENRSDPDADGPGRYAAIDPQPMIGEAEFAIAPLLWNRLHELDRQSPAKALLRRCRDFSAAALLDGEISRQWSLAREVDNALQYAARRQDAAVARSLWVASTLAGRTLEDLPAVHDLPVPA